MIAIGAGQLQAPYERATPETPDAPHPDADSSPTMAATLGVLLRACRPQQWMKNALLIAAPMAAGVIAHAVVVREVVGAVIAFCMLSSATYLLNDVRDVAHDRNHHRKRLRPIASGALGIRTALIVAGALGGGGLALAFAVRPQLAGVGVGYLALTAGYSLLLRRVVVIDILAVAGGFVLRAMAGGAATDVGLSRWFLLVTSFGAVFVVAGKRHAERFGTARADGRTRVTLRRYSQRALRGVVRGAAAGTVLAYALWAFRRPEDGPWYEVTIIPVVAWLGRYALLVGRGAGEAPEELILRDRMLLPLTLAWTALFLGGTYVGR